MIAIEMVVADAAVSAYSKKDADVAATMVAAWPTGFKSETETEMETQWRQRWWKSGPGPQGLVTRGSGNGSGDDAFRDLGLLQDMEGCSCGGDDGCPD